MIEVNEGHVRCKGVGAVLLTEFAVLCKELTKGLEMTPDELFEFIGDALRYVDEHIDEYEAQS